MAIQFPNGFKITSGEPIDSKLVMTKAEMKVAETEFSMPPHYFCVCSEDNKLYVYDENNTEDETIGKFRVVTAEADIQEYLKSVEQADSKVTFKKKDDSTVEVKFKTINGESVLGDGNISVASEMPYRDLSEEASVSLDAQKESGVYKIATASDNPDDTSKVGFLVVNALSDENVDQSWYSNTNYAHRVMNPTAPVEEGFFVKKNDADFVKMEPDDDGNVFLSVSSTGGDVFHLKGTLAGQVIIDYDLLGKAGVEVYTTLVLDGVDITTTTATAIMSGLFKDQDYGDEGRIILEISEGTVNNITSTYVSEERSSNGLIHAEADMYVNGTGTLNLTATHSHGIKASDIIITGKPTMVIDAGHDAIHGKSINIGGGKYTVKNAVDCFSAGSSKNSGLLKIQGGEFVIEKCIENVFQAKKASDSSVTNPDIGRIVLFYDANITIKSGWHTGEETGVAALVLYADDDGSIEIYPSVNIELPTGTTIPSTNFVSYATKYTSGTVYDGSTKIEPTYDTESRHNIYTITSSASAGVYTLQGDFSDAKFVVTSAGVELVMNGVYVNDQSDDDDPFIHYTFNGGTASSKNVKLTMSCRTSTTVPIRALYVPNYFIKKNGSIVTTDYGNANINVGAYSSDMYMSCPNGYAMNVANEARIQNDGGRYFVNSKYGVKANLINCGDEAGDGAEDYTKKKTPLMYFDGNSEYDIEVHHHAYYQGERDGAVNVTANTYTGVFLGKVIKAEGETATITAETHVVVPSTTFTRTPFAYAYKNDLTCTNIIIVSDGETVTGWKVYVGTDAYSKTESDAKYVLKTTYETQIASLIARIEALEGTALNPELDSNGNLTLSHTEIDDEDNVDLLRSTIDDDGNVTLK